MSDMNLKVIRFLDGEATDMCEVLEQASTPEGRSMMECFSLTCDPSFDAPHPPSDALAVWPGTEKYPGVNDHLNRCKWCRLQVLEGRVLASKIAGEFEKVSESPSRFKDMWFSIRKFSKMPRVRFFVPVAAALVAALFLLFRGGDEFDFPAASPSQIGFVKASYPLINPGMGFTGASPIARASWAARAGYSAAWIRDMRSAGLADRSDELVEILSGGSMFPSPEILKLSREGKSPCHLFLNFRDREECEAGALVVGILDSGREPSVQEKIRISKAFKKSPANCTPEIRAMLDGQPEKLDRSILENIVRSGFFN